MKVAIAGGSGFVGKAITKELHAENHDVYILTRNIAGKENSERLAYVQWLNEGDHPEKALEGVDAMINLAGVSLNSGRWTNERKKQIVESRLNATNELNRIAAKLDTKPQVLLNASAVGYYGTSNTGAFTEADVKLPSDFLSETVHQWEQAASKIELQGVRTVYMRFGVILGKDEGALPSMLLPYKLFVGGTVGKGDQWLSWIHIEDVAKAALFCIANPSLQGPVNFTAPEPRTMKEFGKTIASIMHKPHWMPAPAPLMKLALGDMSILVLEGQKVLPAKLIEHGYPFSYPTLEEALQNLLV
ncbi:MAG: TIGR01777 family oxidoreductase [Bacillus sp. (in: firmicutes)]